MGQARYLGWRQKGEGLKNLPCSGSKIFFGYLLDLYKTIFFPSQSKPIFTPITWNIYWIWPYRHPESFFSTVFALISSLYIESLTVVPFDHHSRQFMAGSCHPCTMHHSAPRPPGLWLAPSAARSCLSPLIGRRARSLAPTLVGVSSRVWAVSSGVSSGGARGEMIISTGVSSGEAGPGRYQGWAPVSISESAGQENIQDQCQLYRGNNQQDCQPVSSCQEPPAPSEASDHFWGQR